MPSDADLGELRTLARSIFQKPASEALNVQQTAIPFDESLWKTLVASGLTLLSTPERAGGSGAGIAEAAVVLSVAGEYAAPVPVAETDLLAAWLLDLARPRRADRAAELGNGCSLDLRRTGRGSHRVRDHRSGFVGEGSGCHRRVGAHRRP